jgi:poly(A) polymerase
MAKKNLAFEEWLRSSETRQVMDALSSGASGGEPVARFVGGCVRNGLMNVPVTDIDIATSLAPERVVELIEEAGLKAVPTGIEHGTITAVCEGKPFEITTLRKDVSTDGRRAVVAYTDDWTEDAKRRDFTMNAIFADAAGEIYDPLGGIADLEARRVKFIGDASTRISEDYLRILRFFRIHAVYGQGELDPQGLAACADAKKHLPELSAERVQSELLKLLSAREPVPVLRQMAATGILQMVLPEAQKFDLLDGLAAIDRTQFFTADAVLRLGGLIETDGAETGALADRLRLSNAQKARLISLRTDQPKVVSYMSIREMQRTAYRIGQEALKDRVMLSWAQDPKPSNGIGWRALLEMVNVWERPLLPLSGDDVMLAGVPKGPDVGRVLSEVEDWWVDAGFTDDEFSIAERLKAVVQASVF